MARDTDPHLPMLRMTLYLEDLLSVERNLVRLYDEALVELGAEPAPAASRTDDGVAAAR